MFDSAKHTVLAVDTRVVNDPKSSVDHKLNLTTEHRERERDIEKDPLRR
jgi:hypothetical protein